MRHFDIAGWLDYLRGFAPPPEMAAMEAHLESDCARCWQTVSLLGKLERATRRDREYDVPAESTHLARAAFACADLAQPAGLSTMAARLVFDSFASPALVGIRALRGAERQQRRVLYEAGDYCVDVSSQPVVGSPDVTLIGQVTSRQMPSQTLGGLTVELLSAEGLAASTLSNPQGEFCLHYRPRENMRLRVRVNEQTRVEMELAGPQPGAVALCPATPGPVVLPGTGT